ncbi:cyclin-D4-1-like [Cornus florida]|uniref:cyclin-D4-1-like n=1 Tax=Cornus florida TaxID=4283 RepID=UPI002897E3F6|nr:cyclin-D4-1-like [Cornus florida]
MSLSPDHSAAAILCCAENAADLFSSDAGTSISDLGSSDPIHSPPSDESAVDRLIGPETHHMPHPDQLRSIDLTARQDSINWILKVHAHYHFRPVTAFLSVNYFDRFLSSHSLPASGWPFQLLSVACVSLAAKMEELYVPLLIDLQVSEPRFVFEPQTVQRMELRVMAGLGWRLRSVTPFDYLDYFISCSGSEPEVFARLLSASTDLILKTIRVIDFLGFRPSTIAAAAVICATGKSLDFSEPFYERLNKEMVRSCHQLMEEYLIDTCPSATLIKDRIVESYAPPSPAGVLDAAACGSCASVSVSGSGLGSGSGSASGSREDEPPNKRLRSSATHVQQDQ